MKINISEKEMKVTAAIESYVEKRLEKLDKYFTNMDNEAEVDILFKTEGEMQIAQMAILSGKDKYRAISENEDLYNAIDKVVDILERQINKLKETRTDLARKELNKYEEMDTELLEPENEIIKYGTHSIEPMDPEDAKLVLSEQRNNVFLTFINVFTGKTNVIFKLKDGKNFGLIEPEA